MTEGGRGIGLGHVLETVHVARALRRQRCHALCLTHGPPDVRAHFREAGVPVRSMPGRLNVRTAAFVRATVDRVAARAIVCNVMRLDYRTVEKLRAGGELAVAVISEGDCLGADYGFQIVSQPEFMILDPAIRNFRRLAGDRSTGVVITMGGYDARGLTPRLVRWLGQMRNAPRLRVVVGARFGHRDALERALHRYPAHCEVLHGLAQRELFRVMRDSACAITHGGDTLYELACIGVPALTVCPTVRQLRVARTFARRGNAINLGLARHVRRSRFQAAVRRLRDDSGLRRRLALRGRALVDGRGVDRVAAVLVRMVCPRPRTRGSAL